MGKGKEWIRSLISPLMEVIKANGWISVLTQWMPKLHLSAIVSDKSQKRKGAQIEENVPEDGAPHEVERSREGDDADHTGGHEDAAT